MDGSTKSPGAQPTGFVGPYSELAKDGARLDVHPRLLQAEREAMESQLADLEANLTNMIA